MLRTHSEKYLVHTQGSSAYRGPTTDTHFWFEVLEGEDQGKRLSIPSRTVEYDDEAVRSVISELTGGEVVTAVLEREDESKAWKPVEIEIEYTDITSHY